VALSTFLQVEAEMAGNDTRPIGTTPTPIDGGTLARAISPAPGAAGLRRPDVAAAPPLDPAIEALRLRGAAREAAYALKRAHPSVRFTSGRRSKDDQARAMASNVVKNRNWIGQTYKPGVVSKGCQQWVDDHPEAKTKEQIAAGLLSVMNGASDADVGKVSKHLSGDAFDVQPVDVNAEAIKATIRGLTGLDKFLDKEGGLVRWHAQF
jgi:hypothetical protein